jgi:hypothetical protein
MTLLALIILFLEHALLDKSDETNSKYHKMNICKDKHFLFIYISERLSRSEALPENHIVF